jgi:hypothetical protein
MTPMQIKYRIETETIENYNGEKETRKVAIVESENASLNDKKYHIRTDDNKLEFFTIDNPYNSQKLNLWGKHLGDAIKAVIDGYAHALIGEPNQYNVFAQPVQPIVILDEKTAKEYRKKTIDGWKDSEFGYTVKAGSNNSFSGYRFINNKFEIISVLEDQTDYVFFETEDEARKFVTTYIDKVKNLANELITGKIHIDEAANKALDISDFAETLFYDIISYDENKDRYTYANDEHEFENYGYDIVQALKISKKR